MVNLKKFLLGDALKDDQLKNQKLSRLWGLPIMASDAVSSVAYAVEEILMALMPALGLMAVNYVGIVSFLLFSNNQPLSERRRSLRCLKRKLRQKGFFACSHLLDN